MFKLSTTSVVTSPMTYFLYPVLHHFAMHVIVKMLNKRLRSLGSLKNPCVGLARCRVSEE